jgi:hypothetical protein
LAIPTGEHGAFLRDAIDVRGRMAEIRATTIGPEIIPAGVIGHQYDNIGLLVLSLCRINAASVVSIDPPILWLEGLGPLWVDCGEKVRVKRSNAVRPPIGVFHTESQLDRFVFRDQPPPPSIPNVGPRAAPWLERGIAAPDVPHPTMESSSAKVPARSTNL